MSERLLSRASADGAQIAFRSERTFALVWRPSRYTNTTVPIVLSIALPEPIESSRFKEVMHPSPTTWTHHLELREASQIDDEVHSWLAPRVGSSGEGQGSSIRRSAPGNLTKIDGTSRVDVAAVPLPRLAPPNGCGPSGDPR